MAGGRARAIDWRRTPAGLLFALALIPGAVAAATIEQVAYAHPGEHYTVTLRIQLEVPAKKAFAVMTDFESMPELNPEIVTAEILPNGRLRTVIDTCFAIFCQKVEQVQTVTVSQEELRVSMHILPKESDLEFGRISWHFMPMPGKHSRIIFHAEVEPGFWVPPLVGTWLFVDQLKSVTLTTSKGIEREVRERNR